MNNDVINFTSGLISPNLDCREDLQKYKGGCRILKNMIPEIYGDVTRRPGTEFIVAGSSGSQTNHGCYFLPPPSDPTKIHIYTAEQLQKISYDPAYPRSGDYELMNDIDCSSISQWLPIGGQHVDEGGNNEFYGTFDGRYFTISNIQHEISYTKSENGTGLFGRTNGGAIIKRVIVKNVSITARLYPSTNTTLQQAFDTTISNCGLMVGIAEESTFEDCYVQGTMTGTRYCDIGSSGGFVGISGSLANYTRCGTEINFVVNTALGIIGMCGGFVGTVSHILVATNLDKIFTDCYAIGSATTNSSPDYYHQGEFNAFGGFIGKARYYTSGVDQLEHFINCYSAIIINGGVGYTPYDPPKLGGFVGEFASEYDLYFANCFWDNDLIGDIYGITGDLYDSGKLASTGNEGDIAIGVTKSTTTLMQTQSTFADAGWDFTPNTGVWKIRSGDYPRHQWHYVATECTWV